MTSRIKKFDDLLNDISKTLWVVIVVAVIIIIALFIFCTYNIQAREMVYMLWNKYIEKISIVGLLIAIIWIMADIKSILKYFKEKIG